MKYQNFTRSGCKELGIKKFEVVAKTQFFSNVLTTRDRLISLWVRNQFNWFRLMKSFQPRTLGNNIFPITSSFFLQIITTWTYCHSTFRFKPTSDIGSFVSLIKENRLPKMKTLLFFYFIFYIPMKTTFKVTGWFGTKSGVYKYRFTTISYKTYFECNNVKNILIN